MKKLFTLLLFVMPALAFAQSDSAAAPKKSDPKPVMVEKMPEYPGGNEAMYKFINKKLKYPRQARKNGIEGKVFIQFVIDTDGSVIDAKILKDIGYGCGEAALKVVNKMPKWKPGTVQNKPVKVAFTLPFTFKLT